MIQLPRKNFVWITVVLEFGEISKMSVKYCVSSSQKYKDDLIKLESPKDATISVVLMKWNSDERHFGSSLVYSHRLSWSKWKKQVFDWQEELRQTVEYIEWNG